MKAVFRSNVLFAVFLIFLFLTNINVAQAEDSTIATVSSSVYTVTDDGIGNGKIANVPFGTSKTEFESNIIKDQPDQVWDDSNIQDPVQGGDFLIVTAQDMMTSVLYLVDSGPDASSIQIVGETIVGQILDGRYVYSDLEGDPEGESTFQWYRGTTPITGATSSNYTVQTTDEGKIIYFEVTPVASSGTYIKKSMKSGGSLIDQGPSASSVSITGSPYVGQVVAGSYIYSNSNFVWSDVGSPHFSAGQAVYTAMAISPTNTPFVVYRDMANENKGTVKMFNGTNWGNVGGSYFSDGEIEHFPYIIFGPDNLPYVTYSAVNHGRKIAVKKFNGTDWVNVGTPYFSDGANSSFAKLIFSPTGTPYIAYSDLGHGGKVAVKKFDGADWVSVGAPYFSSDNPGGVYLDIDSGGVPYVLYPDIENGDKATVKKFDGTDWVNVGTPFFSDVSWLHMSLNIDASDTPYVAYRDPTHGGKVTVKKFNGADWVNVGTPYFSDGEANLSQLIFGSQGDLYIGYEDYPNSREGRDWLHESRLTVKKFDTTISDWVNVGAPSVYTNGSDFISFALDSNDTPYFGYDDGVDGWKATVKKLASTVDPEGTSTFQWYRGVIPIEGATSSSYTVQAEDEGKIIYFEVIPAASVGTILGASTKSAGVLILNLTSANNSSLPGSHFVLPRGIGSGSNEIISTNQGQSLDVGLIKSGGLNVLTYINNNNTFSIGVSPEGKQEKYNFYIDNLDLYNKIITLAFFSEPKVVTLHLGEESQVDLNGDKQNDISVKFVDIYVNRAELTFRPLFSESAGASNDKDASPKKIVFGRELKLGFFGSDVKELQRYLNRKGFRLSMVGPGSPGKETNYFGQATRAALIKFQRHEGLITSNGVLDGKTRRLINNK